METKKAASHPDVPRPSNDELVALATEVCHAIEACGASPELTHAVSLASDLATYLRKPDALRADFERECRDTDELLRSVGWAPKQIRTEGGSLRLAELKEALGSMLAPGAGG